MIIACHGNPGFFIRIAGHEEYQCLARKERIYAIKTGNFANIHNEPSSPILVMRAVPAIAYAFAIRRVEYLMDHGSLVLTLTVLLMSWA